MSAVFGCAADSVPHRCIEQKKTGSVRVRMYPPKSQSVPPARGANDTGCLPWFLLPPRVHHVYLILLCHQVPGQTRRGPRTEPL